MPAKRIALLVFTALALSAQIAPEPPQFTAAGELLLPNNYREWVFLSSGLGMTYGPAARADSNNPKFENVFVSRTAYDAFAETGRWPDKTILILEIRRAAEKGSINNGGHYQSGLLSIEAAVKDERRFPQRWAYFDLRLEDRARPLASDSACNACHGRNAAVENTFVQFYPTLLEIARQKGTLRPSYLQTAAEQHP